MNSIILSTVSRLLAALMLVFSVFLLLRGHNLPGGGFAGGLVAAGAFVLHALSFGFPAARRMLWFEPQTIIAAGLIVALGSGEARHERFLRDLQRAFPGRVVFRAGYSEEFAHWIEAASDAFLMPSLYEPCGLNQMYSLKYGTVPIVRRTGGLADSVKQFDPVTGEGTGIVFEHYDSTAVRWSLHRALDLYADRPLWRRLVANGMKQDFSWERQGALYVEQYRRILGR